MSFVDDIAAGVDALGVKNAGIIYGIALTDFESVQARDQFLSMISGKPVGGISAD